MLPSSYPLSSIFRLCPSSSPTRNTSRSLRMVGQFSGGILPLPFFPCLKPIQRPFLPPPVWDHVVLFPSFLPPTRRIPFINQFSEILRTHLGILSSPGPPSAFFFPSFAGNSTSPGPPFHPNATPLSSPVCSPSVPLSPLRACHICPPTFAAIPAPEPSPPAPFDLWPHPLPRFP